MNYPRTFTEDKEHTLRQYDWIRAANSITDPDTIERNLTENTFDNSPANNLDNKRGSDIWGYILNLGMLFFSRASERKLLLIGRVCQTFSHFHIFTSHLEFSQLQYMVLCVKVFVCTGFCLSTLLSVCVCGGGWVCAEHLNRCKTSIVWLLSWF